MPQKGGTPDIEVGDHIYFRHARGHDVGEVKSRGAHGVHVKVGDKIGKVRWEDYLGHKSRANISAAVVDHGDDGILVEHEGRRRFISDKEEGDAAGEGKKPAGDRTSDGQGYNVASPLAKSLMPVVLFFSETGEPLEKAIKGAPGLTLRVITDKTGHQTKRWMKNGEPAHPLASQVKQGDRVGFKAGDFVGEGHVASTGHHGATVHDSTGRKHRIGWDEVHSHTLNRPEQAAP